MKHSQTFNEKLATKLILDNILYDQAGIENAILDGDEKQETLEEFMKLQNLIDLANEHLLESYETGYLKSHKTNIVLESKHLKFLGKEKLEDITNIAAISAFGNHMRNK